MKYRLRYYILLATLPFIAAYCYNSGETEGIQYTTKRYEDLSYWYGKDLPGAIINEVDQEETK